MCTPTCPCDHEGDEQSVSYQVYKKHKEPEWNTFGRTKTTNDDWVQMTWSKTGYKNVLNCFDGKKNGSITGGDEVNPTT